MASSVQRDLHWSPAPDMAPYLVMFDAWRASGASRLEQTRAQVALADANRQRLLEFIEIEGLKNQVVPVAAGASIGAVGIVATPEAARRIESLAGVVRVMPAR